VVLFTVGVSRYELWRHSFWRSAEHTRHIRLPAR
jgi:hypothetical protein